MQHLHMQARPNAGRQAGTLANEEDERHYMRTFAHNAQDAGKHKVWPSHLPSIQFVLRFWL